MGRVFDLLRNSPVITAAVAAVSVMAALAVVKSDTFPWLVDQSLPIGTVIVDAVPLVIGGLGVGVGVYAWISYRPAARQTMLDDGPGTIRTPLPESATPRFLTDFYKDRTSVQGDASVAPYLGKWMTTTTKVRQVSTLLGIVTMDGYAEDENAARAEGRFPIWASLYFDQENQESARLRGRDEIVVIRGRLAAISSDHIYLDYCEFVE